MVEKCSTLSYLGGSVVRESNNTSEQILLSIRHSPYEIKDCEMRERELYE